MKEGDPSTSRKLPGRTEYEAITLEAGLTHDLAFVQWANKVWNFGAGLGKESSLADFRKDVTINFLNEAGQIAMVFNIYRCWVSEVHDPSRPRCQRRSRRHPLDPAPERRLGAGLRRKGTEGAVVYHPRVASSRPPVNPAGELARSNAGDTM